MMLSAARFRKIILGHYKTAGRDLAWRRTRDPYRILVSEIMLQQTQVERVIPYYNKFIRTFPSTRVLARVSFANVLHVWQGLGYNRRAKYLRAAAKILAKTKANEMKTNIGLMFNTMPGKKAGIDLGSIKKETKKRHQQ